MKTKTNYLFVYCLWSKPVTPNVFCQSISLFVATLKMMMRWWCDDTMMRWHDEVMNEAMTPWHVDTITAWHFGQWQYWCFINKSTSYTGCPKSQTSLCFLTFSRKKFIQNANGGGVLKNSGNLLHDRHKNFENRFRNSWDNRGQSCHLSHRYFFSDSV